MLLNVLSGQLDEILPGQRALLALGPPVQRFISLTSLRDPYMGDV